MKLKEFLSDNLPLGKGSVKIPIEGYITNYRKRYNKLKDEKEFKFEAYRTGLHGRVFAHVKVPSETLEKFYYDVLIEVDSSPTAITLRDCDVKFFSNCPSFVYTYAYVLYHTGTQEEPKVGKKKNSSGLMIDILKGKIPKDRLLVPGTEEKLGDDVLGNPPQSRNPHMIAMLDKSIYYAIFYLLEEVPLRYIINTRRFRSESQIIDSVEDFDTLMLKRKREERREKAKKSADKSKQPEVKVVKRGNTMQAVRVTKPNAPTKPTTAKRAVAPKRATQSKTVHTVKAK